MSDRENPLFWSFPMGRLFATRIRVSYVMPLVMLGFFGRFGFSIGLTLCIILLLSTLAHEIIGHVLTARWTGGSGDEVLIWPLGGLAFVSPAPTFSSRFLTALGGPAVNFAICLFTLPTVIMTGRLSQALYPLELPVGQFGSDVLGDVLTLTFYLNWILMLINLLPIFPLDGGQMMDAVLRRSVDAMTSRMTLIRVGLVCALLMWIVGVWFVDKNSGLVMLISLGTFLLIMNVIESYEMQRPERMDESFMGYDFSQGYTSLEREEEREPRVGWWTQWKLKRQAAKLEKEKQAILEDEERLDALLEKVHQLGGVDKLSVADRKQLERLSSRRRSPQDS